MHVWASLYTLREDSQWGVLAVCTAQDVRVYINKLHRSCIYFYYYCVLYSLSDHWKTDCFFWLFMNVEVYCDDWLLISNDKESVWYSVAAYCIINSLSSMISVDGVFIPIIWWCLLMFFSWWSWCRVWWGNAGTPNPPLASPCSGSRKRSPRKCTRHRIRTSTSQTQAPCTSCEQWALGRSYCMIMMSWMLWVRQN